MNGNMLSGQQNGIKIEKELLKIMANLDFLNDIERYGIIEAKKYSKMSIKNLQSLYDDMKSSDCNYNDDGEWMCSNPYRTQSFENLYLELKARVG